MKKHLALLAAAFACATALAQTATVTLQEDRGFQPMSGTRNLGTPVRTEAECEAVLAAEGVRIKKDALMKCRNERVKLVKFNPAKPVTCDAPPMPTSQVMQCAAPLVGSWTQTTTVAIGPAPGCARTTTLSPLTPPNGACTQPAPEPPPPVSNAPTYHFVDCREGAAAGCTPGSNANPGTQERPKQNLAGMNLDTLPAGTRLFFARGGAWAPGMLTLENGRTSAAAPLTFDAYGTGPAPVLRTCSGNLFNLGGGWNNTSDDGGYVIRNLKLDGCGTAEWGIWFIQNVRDVVVENTEITGFRIAINSNSGSPHDVRGITLRNNNIHHNRAMGLLGHYKDILIEGNTWAANNFGGSTFDHGTYIGGGSNITIRNNRYLRNSAVNGQCTGGNMTFHGQIDGMLIEGNIIEQDAAAPQCWLMSITQGYTSAEWFRNVVVRNNVMKNCGNTCLAAQSAPGIVVEGNVVVQTQATGTTAFSVGHNQFEGGDVPDANAVVRNNTVCRRNPAASGSVVALRSPGGSETGNTLVTGAAASTGVCAR